MAISTTTTFADALKILYSNDAIDDLTLPESPFLGMLKKWEQFDGKQFTELLEYGHIKGRSKTFSTAQSNVGGPDVEAFDITRKKDYAIVQLEGELIEASRRKDKAAFLSALQKETDSAMKKMAQSLSHGIYRSSWADRGTISAASGTTGGTVTLTNPDDVVLFEKGDSLVFSSAQSGAVLRSNTASVISNVNRTTGVLTFVTLAAGVTANDYVWIQGDCGHTASAASATPLGISGLDDWIPSSAPGSTAFFGVDRSVDTDRLGGIRFDGSSYTVVDALSRSLSRAFRDNVKISHFLIHPTNFADAVDLLGNKVQYVTQEAFNNPQISFEGFKVMGPGGPVKVLPDPWCPINITYGITLSTWTLRSLNKAPHILDLDNQNLLRLSSSDGYEMRVGLYGNLCCSAPGKNIRVALT